MKIFRAMDMFLIGLYVTYFQSESLFTALEELCLVSLLQKGNIIYIICS